LIETTIASFDIQYERDVPVEVQLALELTLRELLWMLPSWVDHLHISFRSDNDSIMATRVNEEYRYVSLAVKPSWLVRDSAQRRSDVIHEFVHVSVDPLHSVACRLLDLVDDPKLKKWAEEELRLAVERATSDVEKVLLRSAKK
jgi:hypothetical protein